MARILGSNPGSGRRDYHYWARFLDGQVHALTEGEDFPMDRLEATRTAVHSYVNQQNLQWGNPRDVNVRKIQTNKVRNEQGGWDLVIQAFWPYDTSTPA